MTVTTSHRITDIYTQASHVFAEQKVVLSASKKMDLVLDGINEIIVHFENLLPSYRLALEDLYKEFAATQGKKDLIVLLQLVTPLFNLSKRLHKVAKDSKFNQCFAEVNSEFALIISDLKELIEDLTKRIEENKEIDSLLIEIENL